MRSMLGFFSFDKDADATEGLHAVQAGICSTAEVFTKKRRFPKKKLFQKFLKRKFLRES